MKLTYIHISIYVQAELAIYQFPPPLIIQGFPGQVSTSHTKQVRNQQKLQLRTHREIDRRTDGRNRQMDERIEIDRQRDRQTHRHR